MHVVKSHTQMFHLSLEFKEIHQLIELSQYSLVLVNICFEQVHQIKFQDFKRYDFSNSPLSPLDNASNQVLSWVHYPKGIIIYAYFFSVIMLMTGCSFLLSPAAGEKILINCIAILSAILYLLYFAITLPFKRTEVPIIGNTILKNLRKNSFKF